MQNLAFFIRILLGHCAGKILLFNTINFRGITLARGPSRSGKSIIIRRIQRLEKRDKARTIIGGLGMTDQVAGLNIVRCDVEMVVSAVTCSRI